MSDTILIIGQRIRNYRENLDLTQEQLAEMVGCHRTYIGQVERGEKNATIGSIEKMASALHVPLSQLFEKLGDRDICYAKNYPLLCYEIVFSKNISEQKRLYNFLNDIQLF